MQGPWKTGTPSQGYQLPLTPAQLYRAGIEATNAHCRKTYGKSFDLISDEQCDEVLGALSSGKLVFDNGLPARAFWGTVYQTVMEGMFSDPIYGGNRDKAGWRLLGFPGAIAVNRENVARFGPEREPDADLGGSLAHCVRHHAVNADGRQQSSHARKDSQQRRIEAWTGQRI